MTAKATDPGASEADLRRADALFRQALRDGAIPAELEILGYGEISTAVAFSAATGERLALKRLPPFRRAEAVRDYERLFDEYLATLAERGVEPVPSSLRRLENDDDGIIVYCVQPVLDPACVGPALLRKLAASGDHDAVRRHFDTLFATIADVADARVGLDGQLSNWALLDGRWRYLDVTTPLLRDARGRDRLDADLFLAMLPRALRPPVRAFVLRSITGTYHDPRCVAVDFLGNLLKERLAAMLGAGLEAASARLEQPISEDEVRRYYRSDARLWELLLRLRRADRWWQRAVRRRDYPFLLPGRIER